MTEDQAREFARACRRFGVVAFAVANEGGTWRVEMVA